MIRRRHLLAGMLLAPTTSIRLGYAQTTTGDGANEIVGDERFPPGEAVPTVDEILELELALTGPASPYPAEVSLGQRILQNTPTNATPFDVAVFFQDLRLGAFSSSFGSNSSSYATEWPTRANPVIVSFFDATSTRIPNGDVTPWCAAFVNWCHRRARGQSATNSAASQTFRSWGQATTNPQLGDLVVFRRADSPAQGHVGFYLAGDAGNRYAWVLGGNQSPQFGGNSGEVNVKRFDTQSSGNLRFHPFRTGPSLR